MSKPSKKDLLSDAAKLGIEGRSKMTAEQLAEAIAAASKPAERPSVARIPDAPNISGAAAKLAWIQQQLVEAVERTGHHDKFNYDFFQEHGIFKIVKPYLAKVNAGVITDYQEIEYSGNIVRAIGLITLYDATLPRDHEDWGITARYPVAAADNQDKGPYKLQTQGEKYLWQKHFKVPTEAIEDADTDEQTPESTASDSRQAATPKAIAATKAAALRATAAQAVEDGKLDNKKVTAFLQAEFNKSRITELTKPEGEEFEAWLTKAVSS